MGNVKRSLTDTGVSVIKAGLGLYVISDLPIAQLEMSATMDDVNPKSMDLGAFVILAGVAVIVMKL